MRKLKLIGIALASLIVLFYILYLLVLPNVINLSFAKDIAKDIAKEQAGVDVSIGKIKLLTGFPLKAGAKINDISLTCADGTNTLTLKEVKADADIFPLLFKKIKVNNIEISGLDASSDISKDGKLSLEKCFVFPENTQQQNTTQPMDFSIDENLPNIKLSNINLNLKDLETKNVLGLNLEKLFVSKLILNKHITIETKGDIQLNETPNITFDIKADSFLPEIQMPAATNKTPQKQPEYINFIKEFANYNLLADIKSDLKITNDKDLAVIGFANIDGLSYKIKGKQLPVSFMHTKFSNKQGDLDSRIYISEEENFGLTALIKNAKKLNMEASFTTDKISFKNLQELATALLNSLNIKNDFASLKTNGYIISNLKFKTDSKTIQSSGSFRLADGEIISAKDNLKITKINSNINLEDNALNITDTSALINDALIEIKGNITKDAVADISVIAEKMPLAKLASTFLTGELSNYEVKNGILTVKLLLKGKLESIKPSINANLLTLDILDKLNDIKLSNASTSINIDTDGKTFSGNIKSSDIKVNLPAMNLSLAIPALTSDITSEEIKLNNTAINLNNSKINILGNIKNYLQTPAINFTADGNILANDIKNILPKEISSLTTAQGIIPLKAKVNGTEEIKLTAQIFADEKNNFNIITIDKLLNKPSILNADIILKGNNIAINDAGIYAVSTKTLSDNFSHNLNSSNEIIKISGNLINGETLKNIKFTTNGILGISALGVNTDFDANLDINGNVNVPTIKGNINLKKINAPDYLIKGQLANINITPTNIVADVFGLNLNGSMLDIKANAKNSFEMPFLITTMNVVANNIDLDKIIEITTKFPQPATTNTTTISLSNTPMIPVEIKKGIAQVKDFKVGTLGGSNISADFTLKNDILDMKNLVGTAFKGNLTGDVAYDLKNLILTAKLHGENMDANPAVGALIGIKDQIMGTLKFDADISMAGATMEEQLQTLKGSADFEVIDGQLGSLGRIETYLKAANIVSSSFIKTSLNAILDTVLPYNSGQVAKAEGKLTFKDGNAIFQPITSTGKEMSLYVDGYLNMLNYNGDIKILGRLNQEIVNILGPVGNLSADKVLSYIPVIGITTAALFDSLNAPVDENELKTIPELTPKANNKAFKVIIKGNTMSANAVKSFQWLATQEELSNTENKLDQQQIVKPAYSKEELEQIKTNVQTQVEDKLNKVIEKNETLQKIKSFNDFLKTNSTQQE